MDLPFKITHYSSSESDNLILETCLVCRSQRRVSTSVKSGLFESHWNHCHCLQNLEKEKKRIATVKGNTTSSWSTLLRCRVSSFTYAWTMDNFSFVKKVSERTIILLQSQTGMISHKNESSNWVNLLSNLHRFFKFQKVILQCQLQNLLSSYAV